MPCQFCKELYCNCQSRISKIVSNGRFCNQLIKNIAVSFVAERVDLYVEYKDYDKISRLGIPLFVGKNIYHDTLILINNNYMQILMNTPNVNINADHDYFQTAEISQMIYNWFRYEPIQKMIIEKNPYNSRYNKNNDCFVHVRLGDIAGYKLNFDIDFYLRAIKEVGNFDRLYVASDTIDHEIIQGILDSYPEKSEKILLDEIETIQFGSTCRHVILSHGTFSAVIGWLSFYSDVYYPECIPGKMWHGDVFSVNPNWHVLEDNSQIERYHARYG